jgi:hypothetical protein
MKPLLGPSTSAISGSLEKINQLYNTSPWQGKMKARNYYPRNLHHWLPSLQRGLMQKQGVDPAHQVLALLRYGFQIYFL